jgi:hypothetical protein
MAQQTAVEWFYQRILAEDIKEIFEQAKQMEKEQIMRANVDGYNEAEKHGETSAEEYYYEKYTK